MALFEECRNLGGAVATCVHFPDRGMSETCRSSGSGPDPGGGSATADPYGEFRALPPEGPRGEYLATFLASEAGSPGVVVPFLFSIKGYVQHFGVVRDSSTLNYTVTDTLQWAEVRYGRYAPWDWALGESERIYSGDSLVAEIANSGCQEPNGCLWGVAEPPVWPPDGGADVYIIGESRGSITAQPGNAYLRIVAGGVNGDVIGLVNWDTSWRHRLLE